MKKLLLIIIFITGCAAPCPAPKPKELTYAEKREKIYLEYINDKIDKNTQMGKEDKEITKELVKCITKLIPNRHTVSNLMPWQSNALRLVAEEACNDIIQGAR